MCRKSSNDARNVVILFENRFGYGVLIKIYYNNSDEWKNFLDFIGIDSAKSLILSEFAGLIVYILVSLRL